jgi:hypothetical protein
MYLTWMGWGNRRVLDLEGIAEESRKLLAGDGDV